MKRKNKKIKYSMPKTDEELKLLKKSINYVKNLDIFNENKNNEDKETNKNKKVA